VCANEVDVAIGRMVYTAVLNARGGFESDCTVMRMGVDEFLLVTGSAQPLRDADWIRRQVRADEFVVLNDVSAAWCVLSLMGPNAKPLLARLSPDDLAIPFSHTREIDLGLARVRAARMSYVGGPGYELYVPVELARHVYHAVQAAGADLGLVDAGYYALDALRIEAGRRAWGAELGPDESPHEAGLWLGVRRDKPGFIGREALLAREAAPRGKKLLSFVLDDPAAWVWGGEAIVIEGETVGELSSAGWSLKAGRCIALGYVRGAAAQAVHAGTPVLIDLWGQLKRATAWDDAVGQIRGTT